MVSVQVVYVISLDRMVQKHAAKSKQNHILINEKIKTDIIYKSHNKGGEAKMITKDDRAYKTLSMYWETISAIFIPWIVKVKM